MSNFRVVKVQSKEKLETFKLNAFVNGASVAVRAVFLGNDPMLLVKSSIIDAK